MIIRCENPADYQAVHCVNVLAFGRSAEANLVEVLRKEASPYISLVAEDEGEVVGHILFTPVSLSGGTALKIMGLGPMAVIPNRQRMGSGSVLVRKGLHGCVDLGYGACVVLGHPWFYPRFGFVPSVKFEIGCEYDVLPEVFMVVELIPGYLQAATGIIHYHPAFDNV